MELSGTQPQLHACRSRRSRRPHARSDRRLDPDACRWRARSRRSCATSPRWPASRRAPSSSTSPTPPSSTSPCSAACWPPASAMRRRPRRPGRSTTRIAGMIDQCAGPLRAARCRCGPSSRRCSAARRKPPTWSRRCTAANRAQLAAVLRRRSWRRCPARVARAHAERARHGASRRKAGSCCASGSASRSSRRARSWRFIVQAVLRRPSRAPHSAAQRRSVVGAPGQLFERAVAQPELAQMRDRVAARSRRCCRWRHALADQCFSASGAGSLPANWRCVRSAR